MSLRDEQNGEPAHHATVVLDETVDQALDDFAQPVERRLRPFLGVLRHDRSQRFVDRGRPLLEVAGRLRDDAGELRKAGGVVLLGRLGRGTEPQVLDGVNGELLQRQSRSALHLELVRTASAP